MASEKHGDSCKKTGCQHINGTQSPGWGLREGISLCRKRPLGPCRGLLASRQVVSRSRLRLRPGFQNKGPATGSMAGIGGLMLTVRCFPGGAVVKNPPANAGNPGDVGSIPGLGRSPGEGNGKPLQSSCLGSPVGRGAQQATVHRVAKSRTQLSH